MYQDRLKVDNPFLLEAFHSLLKADFQRSELGS